MNDTAAPASPRPSERDVLRAVPPTPRTREFRVGVFVILGIVGFFTVLFFMTSPATFRGRYMVATRVEDAQGIRRGDPVQMRGINIGRVHRFDLDPGGVLITLEIEGRWSIPTGSRSELSSSGILGGMVVSVVPGTGEGFVAPHGEIPGEVVGGVLDSAGDLTVGAGDVLARIQALLSDSAVTDVVSSVASLRDILNDLAALTGSQTDQLRSLTESLRRSAENVEGVTGAPEWTRTLASAESALSTLDRVSGTTEEAVASLNTLLARVEQGEGTLGQLSANDALYNSVTAAAESLRVLLDDVKANPGRYLKIEVF